MQKQPLFIEVIEKMVPKEDIDLIGAINLITKNYFKESVGMSGICTVVEERGETFVYVLGTNTLVYKEVESLGKILEIETIEKIQPKGFAIKIGGLNK